VETGRFIYAVGNFYHLLYPLGVIYLFDHEEIGKGDEWINNHLTFKLFSSI